MGGWMSVGTDGKENLLQEDLHQDKAAYVEKSLS